MERLGRDLGQDLWVKRDDLTGAELSGNKVRKLEFLCAQALAQGADTLVTCGAVGSNHARATAYAAARLGMRSHLVLRGADRDPPDGNLLLDRLLGTQIEFITREQWTDRDRILADVVRRLARSGRRGYAIPEGGSNALGAMGYAVAVEEVLGQAEEEGIRVRRLVHAVGSGGTTAGLALGVAASGRDDVEVVGVAVCDDRAYFDARIAAILDQAAAAGFATGELRSRCRWRILEGYKGTGYAETSPEEMRGIAEVARREGVVLDPVYTGKAFAGLAGEARAGRLGDGATVFVHTGGIFGLFAYADRLREIGPTA